MKTILIIVLPAIILLSGCGKKPPIDMVRVDRGEFIMGTSSNDYTGPAHRVVISRPFYISKYEITFDAYDEYCKETKKNKPFDEGWGRGDRPVIHVSWYEAVQFCNWLSKKYRLKQCYENINNKWICNFNADGFRLPTEAEWEYAARGGNKTKGYSYSGSNDCSEAGWYSGNAGKKTHPVGEKKPNELGIFDMSGNVWEWCNDWSKRYSPEAQTDPRGETEGTYKTLRGGSWNNSEKAMEITTRLCEWPAPDETFHTGFRVACTASKCSTGSISSK